MQVFHSQFLVLILKIYFDISLGTYAVLYFLFKIKSIFLISKNNIIPSHKEVSYPYFSQKTFLIVVFLYKKQFR
jgi:hypothetical protein